MGDLMRNKIMLYLDDETIFALNRYYFGDIDKYYTIDNGNPLGKEEFPCGSIVLDSYAPTSTLQGCAKIAKDSILDARDLFIHHIFREGIAPERMRSHISDTSKSYKNNRYFNQRGNVIMADVSFIKWILERSGLKVHGTAVTECDSRYTCNWLASAYFFVSDISGINAAVRRYASGDRVDAATVFKVFQEDVRNMIIQKIKPLAYEEPDKFAPPLPDLPGVRR